MNKNKKTNKYQNAYERLNNLLNISDASDEDYDALETVESLVDKTVPMTVTDIHVDEFYCPSCHGEICHDKSNVESRPNYCEWCGQKLKFEDEKDEYLY